MMEAENRSFWEGAFMEKARNQRLKLLYLRKILLEQTDEDHPITVARMIAELEKAGIHAQRKSIYADLADLRRFGMDIVSRRSRTMEYFAANRTFELPELKLLADAVACSKFLTEKKSGQLIAKISGLASGPQAAALRRQVFVCGRVKTQNEKIYYNVDTIHQAIAQGRAVSFRYFAYCVDWDAPQHWTKRYRRGGETHVAFPYTLAWTNENYYMTAYYEKYGGISNFRVDKMEDVTVLDEAAGPRPGSVRFDPAVYSKEAFGMFSGWVERMTLRFDDSLIGVVLDRFGGEIEIRRAAGGGFLVTVDAIAGPTLLGWLFGFGEKAKIVAPKGLAEQFCSLARESLAQYGENGKGEDQ